MASTDQTLSLCRVPVTVTTIYRDDNEVQAAKGGENLRLRLGGVDEDEVSPGFVLCSRHLPVPAVTYFDAQLHLLDLLEHKSLFSAGYKAILHIHAAVEECEITALLAQIDPKTKQKKNACLLIVSCMACAGSLLFWMHAFISRLSDCRSSKRQEALLAYSAHVSARLDGSISAMQMLSVALLCRSSLSRAIPLPWPGFRWRS